jgi:hypothetical protein
MALQFLVVLFVFLEHAVLTAVAAAHSYAAAAGPPNILIILADDLGYGDLGVTGHPTSRTPAIDKLAQTGLRLTSFYTASPVCSPSRAGIATGRFPARSGVYCADNTYACGGPPHNGTATDYRECCNGVFLPGMPGGMSKKELTVAQLLQPRGCEFLLACPAECIALRLEGLVVVGACRMLEILCPNRSVVVPDTTMMIGKWRASLSTPSQSICFTAIAVVWVRAILLCAVQIWEWVRTLAALSFCLHREASIITSVRSEELDWHRSIGNAEYVNILEP